MKKAGNPGSTEAIKRMESIPSAERSSTQRRMIFRSYPAARGRMYNRMEFGRSEPMTQSRIVVPSAFLSRSLLGVALSAVLSLPVLARPQAPAQPPPPPTNAPQTPPTAGPAPAFGPQRPQASPQPAPPD